MNQLPPFQPRSRCGDHDEHRLCPDRVIFDRVWKKFRRGERHDSLRDLVPALARGLLHRTDNPDLGAQEFWALQDVCFEVDPGEALGLIGPNGAGKSTALKLLTRILRATRGHCAIHGRAGALIEVAAGFHPDLTGRENIFLQGAILGMTRHEVKSRMKRSSTSRVSSRSSIRRSSGIRQG